MRVDPGTANLFRPLPSVQAPTPDPVAPGQVPAAGPSPFLQRLGEAVRDVNTLQQDASTQATQLATGQAKSVEDVVIAMEKADLALQLTVQVTQKAVEAYREISRMQV